MVKDLIINRSDHNALHEMPLHEWKHDQYRQSGDDNDRELIALSKQDLILQPNAAALDGRRLANNENTADSCHLGCSFLNHKLCKRLKL
ncbi:hypothetical protein [Paenibacillus sp. LPE1-1-1.1]|uniref:hypothetical protein n=1 Tax=Paenibacillus sp. LPE1-1-1.1 TaxID=3135230 RepID=UPI00341367A4